MEVMKVTKVVGSKRGYRDSTLASVVRNVLSLLLR
jgi:hypothetical protein